MSKKLWGEIEQKLEQSRIAVEIERSASRVRMTAEVFTPSPLVCRLLSQLDPNAFAPGKKVLDPACGDGQFLYAIKIAKMEIWNQTEDEALSDIFGIDILKQNVEICRKRLGGGTIVIGNALRPTDVVPGQKKVDKDFMQLFADENQLSLF
jgi:2-polyprenyl-3-methyl-5-hydroxy-6-metoxy-1,4-benzoquinol methylase